MALNAYEARRAEQISRNKRLLNDLGLDKPQEQATSSHRPAKKRRFDSGVPSDPARSSTRLSTARWRPNSAELGHEAGSDAGHRPSSATRMPVSASSHYPISKEQLDEIRLGWTTWTATEPRPTRDASGTLHFASHPDFQPNKSPSEILREGSFGGTYFRPLYSKALGTTISDDWRELPSSWVKGLNISKFLTSSEYDPTINKFGVACGQSIEEWEAAGWIHHQYDVRGWLQWYCRFFMGRRCDDDEWQIGRWMRCAGDTGRWKRALLKNYVAMGVRNVADEGLDEAESVSPVIHQTCHHWAFEAKQPILDEFWETQ